MALIAAQCPCCGGSIQLDDDKEKGFCLYCGAELILDAIKIVIDQSTTINIDAGPKAENFVRMANESNDPNQKEQYLSQALLLNPESAEARLRFALLHALYMKNGASFHSNAYALERHNIIVYILEMSIETSGASLGVLEGYAHPEGQFQKYTLPLYKQMLACCPDEEEGLTQKYFAELSRMSLSSFLAKMSKEEKRKNASKLFKKSAAAIEAEIQKRYAMSYSNALGYIEAAASPSENPYIASIAGVFREYGVHPQKVREILASLK